MARDFINKKFILSVAVMLISICSFGQIKIVNYTTTDVQCFGGSDGTLSFSTKNGPSPFTYILTGPAEDTVLTTSRTYTFDNLLAGVYILVVRDASGKFDVRFPVEIFEPAELDTTDLTTISNPTCPSASDGSIILDIEGGTPPYTYNWSNGVTTKDNFNLSLGNYTVTVTDNHGCQFVKTFSIANPLPISLNPVVTDVSCAGGNNGGIDLNVTGGTLPYSFNWSTGEITEDISGLIAGSYSITVTDANGCAQLGSFNITEPTPISNSGIVTDASCSGGNNGQINLSVSGGTSPFSYLWSNGATTQDLSNLSAGSYSVTVTDNNGCTSSANFTISSPSAIVISGTITNPSCAATTNGKITTSISGGTSPYTFLWSTGATSQNLSNVATGVYTLTVTDAKGCTNSNTFNINNPTPISITGATTNAQCLGVNNGSIDITASGGTPSYTYLWSTGATTQDISGLSSGNYSVIVTDNNGCTKNASFTINQPPALTITNSNTDVKCFAGNSGAIDITVSGGTTPYIYSWNNGATSQDINSLTEGSYTVIVTDNNGCSQSNTYSISQPATALTASGTTINISCNGGSNGSIDLTVNGGTTPYSYSWNTGATSQDLSGLAAGNYNVTVIDANGCSVNSAFTLTEPAGMTLSSITSNISCNGGNNGAINLSVIGGASPYTYSWSNGAITEDISSLAAGTYNVTVTDAGGCTKSTSFTITEPLPVSVSGVSTNAQCLGINNGSIDITVSGGTAPYTYSWSNGATSQDLTGLSAGTYSVIVKDNKGCTKNASFTIIQPAALNITNSNTNINCFAGNTGAIDISVSGGTAPYTYSWSNGASSQDINSLTAGSYTVVITDNNGCTQSNTYTITQPATALTASGATVNISCNGGNNGSIDLSVIGGTAPYTYSWNTGAISQDLSGLIAGIYSVTVTDSKGCTVNSSFTLTEPVGMILSGTLSNVSCNGGNNGSIDLTISGGSTPYTFVWSNGTGTEDISGLAAGNYSVTVADAGGCSKSASFTITEPLPVSISGVSNNAQCLGINNGSIDITVSGGTAPYTYSWSNGATSQDLTNLAGGSFSVVVTDSKGCSKNASFTITQPAALSITNSNTDVNCFAGNNGAIDITVTGGTTPYTYSWSTGTTSQDMNSLTAGNYTVIVTDNNGCSQSNTYTITQPATALTASGTTVNILCNGGSNGSIDLTVTGGTSPYTYTWSNGALSQDLSSLVSGNYSVTVTDSKGCTVNTSFTLTEPAGMTLSGTSSNVSCNGGTNGTIDLTAAGGSTPYSFVWSNGAGTEDISGLAAGNYSVTVTDAGGCSKSASFTITEPLPVSVSGISNNAQCLGINNGSIDITVSGGTVPYTYSWSNGAISEDLTNLAGGTFSVVVTDSKGCSKNASFTITQPAALTITNSNTDVNCFAGNNGAIDITVTGGTTPYTYSWSTGTTSQDINSLTAGNYTVIVTDNNGCSQSNTYTITQPATALTASGTTVNISCNGGSDGSIDLTVNGGTAPYSYSWNTGAMSQDLSGLVAGNYNVTVTDSKGCTVNNSFSLTEPAGMTLSGVSSDVNCNGGNDGSIDLSVVGGTAPYTFAWNNGAITEDISGLIAGNYNVTVTDGGGCSKSTSFTITEPLLPISVTGISNNAQCLGINNGSIDITVSGGTVPYTYSWNNGATSEDLTNLAGGIFSVVVTDGKGCTQNSSFTITQPAALTITNINTNVSCFAGNNGAIDITVSGGTAPYTYSWNTGSTSEDINALTAGSFTVIVTDNNGCSQSNSYTISQPATALTASGTQVDISCNGGNNGSIDLTVNGGTSPYTYSWNTGATTQDLSGLVAGNYQVTVTDNNGCITNVNFTIIEPAPIVATPTITNVKCNSGNDGSISLLINGGNAPYNFNWSNGANTQAINNLIAGSYTVTITDNSGCSINNSYSITEPTSISINGIATSPSCNNPNDGSIDITVNGGTQPYTYLWSSGEVAEDISNKSTGTYSVVVTDVNACTTSASFSISAPQPLDVTATITPSDCNTNDGSIVLTVNNGLAPITYLWSTGETTSSIANLAVGPYSVKVTDSRGCTKDSTFIISNPAIFTYNLNLVAPQCNGGNDGSIEVINISGGKAPFDYSFNSGAFSSNPLLNGISAGNYLISIRDANGCQADSLVILTEPSALKLTGTSNSPVCLNGNSGTISLTANGGSPAYFYSNDNIDFNTNNSFFGVTPGTNTYYVRDINGCSASTAVSLTTFPIVDTTNIVANIKHLTCYLINTGEIELSNITGGNSPYSYSLNGGPSQSTPKWIALGQGNYTITIQDANGCNYHYQTTINSPAPIDFTLTPVKVETCNNKDASFVLSGVMGGIPGYTYSYNNFAPVPYTGPVTFDNLSSGSYSVEVFDNSNGCSVTKTIALPKKPAPIPFVRIDSTLCFGSKDGKIIIDSLEGGAPLFTISIQQFKGLYADTIKSLGSHELGVFNGLAADTFLMKITDQECTYDINYYYLYKGIHNDTVDYDTIVSPLFYVKQPEPISVKIGVSDTEKDTNNGAVILTNFVGGVSPYTYSLQNIPGTYKPVVNDRAVISQLGTGTYKAFVKDSNQCVYSFDFAIGIGFFIPNLITPNGDGFNDRFEIIGLPINSNLRIYNRWDSKVYSNESYDNSWDGEDAPDGIYYYDLELPNHKIYKGWIEVLRK